MSKQQTNYLDPLDLYGLKCEADFEQFLAGNDLARAEHQQRLAQANCKTCLDHGYLDEWWRDYPTCPDCGDGNEQ